MANTIKKSLIIEMVDRTVWSIQVQQGGNDWPMFGLETKRALDLIGLREALQISTWSTETSILFKTL